jgi:hypothetical protein
MGEMSFWSAMARVKCGGAAVTADDRGVVLLA